MKSIVGLGRALVDACINDEDIIPILKLLIGPIEQGHNHFYLTMIKQNIFYHV